jgi:acyl-CoA thioesterase FadM
VNYRLTVDFDALQFLFSLRKADQIRLAWWLERLRNSPFSLGQSIVVDPTGRDVQVSKVSRFRVFHWTDHPVKTVQVVKIELNN